MLHHTGLEPSNPRHSIWTVQWQEVNDVFSTVQVIQLRMEGYSLMTKLDRRQHNLAISAFVWMECTSGKTQDLIKPRL